MPTLARLDDEHRDLLAGLEQLRALGDAADRSLDVWLPLLDDAIDFLHARLLTHAAAEEDRLYPGIAGAGGGTTTALSLAREHRVIEGLAEDLAGFRRAIRTRRELPSHMRDVRRIAYGLHTLVGSHLAAEAEIYRALGGREPAPPAAGPSAAVGP